MSFYVNPHAHSCPWHPYSELFGAPNINWCEETMCHWVSNPANTYSNLAYILVALLLAIITQRRANNESDVFVKLIFGLGLASAFYHMSNNFLGQILDFTFIFLFIFWGVSFNLKRLEIIKEYKDQWKVTGGLTLFFMILVFIMYYTHLHFQLLIPVAALILVFSEFKARKLKDISYKYLYAALVSIGIGQIFSILDRTGTVCDPTNHQFQGHALWHILSAIGLGLATYHWYKQVASEYIEPEVIVHDDSEYSDHDEVYIDVEPDINIEIEEHDINQNDNNFTELKKPEPKAPEADIVKLNTGEADIDPLEADTKVEEVDDSQLGFDSITDDDEKDKDS